MTDQNAKLYEHLEYFPFGETWVEEHSNIQRTPYLFTGKELDEETQLYYYGARYYDPRTSVWQSADPILEKYMEGGGNTGGVYASANLSLYSYVHNSPVIAYDPDGKDLTQSLNTLKGYGKGLLEVPVGVLTFGNGSIAEVFPPRTADESAGYTTGLITGIVATAGLAAIVAPAARSATTESAVQVTGAGAKGGRNLPFKDADRLTEANKTLDRIESGGPFPHKKDGTIFRNKEGKLPDGNYREYTVDTPGASNRGTRRVVQDIDSGKTHYTDEHYDNFIQIDPAKR